MNAIVGRRRFTTLLSKLYYVRCFRTIRRVQWFPGDRSLEEIIERCFKGLSNAEWELLEFLEHLQCVSGRGNWQRLSSVRSLPLVETLAISVRYLFPFQRWKINSTSRGVQGTTKYNNYTYNYPTNFRISMPSQWTTSFPDFFESRWQMVIIFTRDSK